VRIYCIDSFRFHPSNHNRSSSLFRRSGLGFSSPSFPAKFAKRNGMRILFLVCHIDILLYRLRMVNAYFDLSVLTHIAMLAGTNFPLHPESYEVMARSCWSHAPRFDHSRAPCGFQFAQSMQ